MSPFNAFRSDRFTRREFAGRTMLGAAALASVPWVSRAAEQALTPPLERSEYRGPRVIIIRYGGGTRRRESIDPLHTHSPFLCHELIRRGVLFNRMEIDRFRNVNTSHGEGTLYILTGKYDRFQDVEGTFLRARFESTVPTLFEYLRRSYDVPAHETLIVNGEDRADEEFYNFSNHHLFGAEYRCHTLSLLRYKTYLLREQLRSGGLNEADRQRKEQDLAKFEAIDHRDREKQGQGKEIGQFWENWRAYYGETGLVNPRGDRLLTELTVRALKELRPKLLMVNYQDTDYVHWGYPAHYTRAIAVMDEGIRRIVEAVESDDEYRENTLFVVVPDCGRDDNPFVAVPFQHHFNSRSAHEIFALFFGAGIPAGQVVDQRVDQISVAATIGHFMGFKTGYAEGPPLEEVIA